MSRVTLQTSPAPCWGDSDHPLTHLQSRGRIRSLSGREQPLEAGRAFRDTRRALRALRAVCPEEVFTRPLSSQRARGAGASRGEVLINCRLAERSLGGRTAVLVRSACATLAVPETRIKDPGAAGRPAGSTGSRRGQGGHWGPREVAGVWGASVAGVGPSETPTACTVKCQTKGGVSGKGSGPRGQPRRFLMT